MSTLSFGRGVLLALALAMLGAVAHLGLAPWIGPAYSLRFALLLVGTLYWLALLAATPQRSGRMLALAAWGALVLALAVFYPPLTLWLLAATGGFWLLRSLLRYQSLLPAALDATLSACALGAAVIAAQRTHSLFLALWCYFLAQALIALLPRGTTVVAAAGSELPDFDSSYRNAEAALRRLSVRS